MLAGLALLLAALPAAAVAPEPHPIFAAIECGSRFSTVPAAPASCLGAAGGSQFSMNRGF